MKIMTGILSITLIWALLSCSPGNNAVNTESQSAYSTETILETLSTMPVDSASDSLETFLRFIREEEKLARDVYLKSFELYGSVVFERISGSEQRHMDAIKILLDRYNIDDPVGENPEGIFINNPLAELYDTLTGQSADSLVSALKVGAEIEEIDILDIQQALDTYTQEDVNFVLTHLLYGSYHHLVAYVRNLRVNSVEYQPKYLSPEQYETILELGSKKGRLGKNE